MNGYRKIILPEDKTITERYDIEQVNGQRIITLKNIPSIEHLVDTEIYISAIPRDCTEFHLVPIFEKHPKLLEFRLMMEFSGQNRGYSFAKYATPEQAATAVKIFSGMIIGKYRIDVSLSLNNRKLLIYDLPPAESLPTKVIEQTLQENTPLVKSVTEGSDGSAPGPRRDLIVEYQTHRAAAMARKTLLAPGGFHIGPHIIQVDWAIPDCLVGFGDPVSASGQGEKAGSQASSSNDCSSSLVGNLATGEYTITGRKLSDKTSSLQKRRQKSNKRTAELSSEELEERKKKRRLYMKNYRAKQSKEATQVRLQHLRQSAAERRDTESEQARKARLQQMRQHAAETRDSESELAKEARLQQMRQHAAETRDSESELAKQARLQQMRQHATETRDSESELAKEARLQKMRYHAAETRDSESELAKEARLQQVKPNERENEQKAVVPYISRNNELRKVMKPTDIYRIMMPTEMCQVMKPFTEIRQIHGMRQVSTPSQILQIPASMDLQQKSLDICKIPFSVDRYNPENPVVSLNVLARPNSTQALLHFAIHGSSVPRFITTKQRAPGTPLIAML